MESTITAAPVAVAAVPKVRARVMESSSIRAIRMTEDADRAIANVQAAFGSFGKPSASMIVRVALEKYAQYIEAIKSNGNMPGEWSKLTKKCHVTRDK